MMENFTPANNNPFAPVYLPSAEQSTEYMPIIDFKYHEKIKALWQSVHDDEAGSSLDQRFIYGDNNPKNYKTGKLISAKEANEKYPVDIPHTQDVYEDEARFMKRRYDKQEAYERVMTGLDPISSFLFGTVIDMTGNIAVYASLGLAAGATGAVAARAFRGTTAANRALKVWNAYKTFGGKGPFNRIGQFSISLGLEEAAEETIISPLRGQMALESGRQFGWSDVALNAVESFAGGALLGGVIGGGYALFENRSSVYNYIHKFYNKAFSPKRAGELAVKAELDTSMGYVPNTEAILQKHDNQLHNKSRAEELSSDDATIEPDIDSDVYGGFSDINTVKTEADLTSTNIPLEANFGQGFELSNSKKLVTMADGTEAVIAFSTTGMKVLDLDYTFTDPMANIIADYFQEKFGLPLSKGLEMMNLSGYQFLQQAIKGANALDPNTDHGTALINKIKEVAGTDVMEYTAGTVGENGTISYEKEHKVSFVLNPSKLQVKGIEPVGKKAESTASKQGEQASAPVDSANEYYKKPEALQNFDPEIQLKIEEAKKLHDELINEEKFFKDKEKELDETNEFISAELKSLKEVQKELEKALVAAEKAAKAVPLSKAYPSVKDVPKYKTFEEAVAKVKVDENGFASNLSNMVFYHGGFNKSLKDFNAPEYQTHDIYYGTGKYFSDVPHESATYAYKGSKGDISTVEPHVFNPESKMLVLHENIKMNDVWRGVFGDILDKLKAKGFLEKDNYGMTTESKETLIKILSEEKTPLGFIYRIRKKHNQILWDMVTDSFIQGNINGFVIPNQRSFGDGYQLEAVVFQSSKNLENLQKNVAILNQKKIDSLQKIADSVIKKEEYSKFMQSILFCTRKPE